MATLLQLAPGMVVGGDFRVLEPLGSGGMGALYVAEQLSTGKRRALKVMHRQLLRDPRQRERFVQEARVGSLIESDHVVEVIAAGVEEASGVPWIAMELLDGRDLADFAAEHGRLSPGETLAVLHQLCHALGAAHRAGVVHRDVKPENVFVARSRRATGPTAVKVLDFGIAKVAAQAKSTGTAAVGSPAWMAPEQTRAHVTITAAADVWAVGLITYWLLTGELYWSSTRDPEASIHALMREVLFDPLAAASARAEEHHGEGYLPPGFDGWFARCVTRDPEARFADAGECFASLEQLLLTAGVEPYLEPSASERPSYGRISTMPIGSSGERRSVPPPAAPPVPLQAALPPTLPDASDGALPPSRPVSTPPPAVPTLYAEPSWGDDEPSVEPRLASQPSARPEPISLNDAAAAQAGAARALGSATGAGMETPAEGAADDIPRLPLRSWGRALGGVAIIALAFVVALLVSSRGVRRVAPATVMAQTASGEPAPGTTAAEARSAASVDGPVALLHPAATSTHAARAATGHGAPAAGSSAASATAGRPEAGPGHRPFATPPEPSAGQSGARGPGDGMGPPAPPPGAGAQDGARGEGSSAGGADSEPAGFNRAEAHSAVERQAAFARMQCWGLPGPRLIAADVVFGASGLVERVALAQHEQLEGSTTSCVRNVLRGARIHPYIGKPERIGVLISLL